MTEIDGARLAALNASAFVAIVTQGRVVMSPAIGLRLPRRLSVFDRHDDTFAIPRGVPAAPLRSVQKS